MTSKLIEAVSCGGRPVAALAHVEVAVAAIAEQRGSGEADVENGGDEDLVAVLVLQHDGAIVAMTMRIMLLRRCHFSLHPRWRPMRATRPAREPHELPPTRR